MVPLIELRAAVPMAVGMGGDKDLAAGQGHFGLSLGFVLGGGAKE